MRSPAQKGLDLASGILGALSLGFPILALVAARTVGTAPVLILLVICLCLRFVLPAARRVPAIVAIAPLFVVGVLAAIAYLATVDLAVRLYPVLMNLTLLIAFSASLVRAPSVIEQFARVLEPDLPASGVRYTWWVTLTWSVFFLLNGLIALWVALTGSWGAWGLYNGVIAYIAMAVLFGVEYAVRIEFRRQHA